MFIIILNVYINGLLMKIAMLNVQNAWDILNYIQIVEQII